MKKIAALFLAALFLVFSLTGCQKEKEKPEATGGGTNVTTQGGEVSGTDTGEVIPPAYTDELPEGLKFDGKDVRMLSRDLTNVSDELTVKRMTGSIVNDAVFNRQKNVEERLGIRIKNNLVPLDPSVMNWSVIAKYEAAMNAGDDMYDIIAGPAYVSARYVPRNYFYDLYNADIATYMNLDKQYWSPLVNDAMRFGDAQYLCTGHIALTMYRYMFATYFNTEIFADNGIDLFDIVDKGQWTLDKQKEIALILSQEMGGDPSKVELNVDRAGFLTSNSVSIDPYWSSCGLEVIAKNSQDTYDLVLYNPGNYEKLAATLQKLVDMRNTNGILMINYETGDAEQETIVKAFASGKAAMVTLRLAASEDSTLAGMKYGLVPIARLSETQESYNSFVHDMITAFAIPSIIPPEDHNRLQMIGAFLEAMASESYRTVRPAYYEKVLKNRYLNDIKSWDMLDYMIDHVKIDAGILYTKDLESIHQDLRYNVRDNYNSLATRFGEKRTKVESAFNKLKTSLYGLTEN